MTPLIWNDSTAFLSSAVSTITSGTLQVLHGANVGYVYFLSRVFSWGGDLLTVVLLQKIIGAFSIALCAFTVFKLVRNRWFSLPLGVAAVYPGILIHHNLVLAESLYASALTMAICTLVLASGASRGSSERRVASLLLATLTLGLGAALLKVQGWGPLIVVCLAALFIASRVSMKLVSLCVCAIALVTLGALAGNQARSASNDPTSALFGSKTLFCFHLDIILQAPSTAAMARASFAGNASAFMDKLHADLGPGQVYPTLGFNADACQFDKSLDAMGIQSQAGGLKGLVDWYRKAFVNAVVEFPHRYLAKVARQLLYGLKMAVPPHGLGETIGSVGERERLAATTLQSAGLSARGLQAQAALSAPLLSHFERSANLGLRLFSLPVSAALVLALAGLALRRWRHSRFAVPAALASLVWWSQIGVIALTHTLDVWRYMVPVVPAAILTLCLVAANAFDLWQQGRQGQGRARTPAARPL
ncbi:MAG: hypothetical protein V4669_02335 [Pseudomonadota bacterium]